MIALLPELTILDTKEVGNEEREGISEELSALLLELEAMDAFDSSSNDSPLESDNEGSIRTDTDSGSVFHGGIGVNLNGERRRSVSSMNWDNESDYSGSVDISEMEKQVTDFGKTFRGSKTSDHANFKPLLVDLSIISERSEHDETVLNHSKLSGVANISFRSNSPLLPPDDTVSEKSFDAEMDRQQKAQNNLQNPLEQHHATTDSFSERGEKVLLSAQLSIDQINILNLSEIEAVDRLYQPSEPASIAPDEEMRSSSEDKHESFGDDEIITSPNYSQDYNQLNMDEREDEANKNAEVKTTVRVGDGAALPINPPFEPNVHHAIERNAYDEQFVSEIGASTLIADVLQQSLDSMSAATSDDATLSLQSIKMKLGYNVYSPEHSERTSIYGTSSPIQKLTPTNMKQLLGEIPVHTSSNRPLFESSQLSQPVTAAQPPSTQPIPPAAAPHTLATPSTYASPSSAVYPITRSPTPPYPSSQVDSHIPSVSVATPGVWHHYHHILPPAVPPTIPSTIPVASPDAHSTHSMHSTPSTSSTPPMEYGLRARRDLLDHSPSQIHAKNALEAIIDGLGGALRLSQSQRKNASNALTASPLKGSGDTQNTLLASAVVPEEDSETEMSKGNEAHDVSVDSSKNPGGFSGRIPIQNLSSLTKEARINARAALVQKIIQKSMADLGTTKMDASIAAASVEPADEEPFKQEQGTADSLRGENVTKGAEGMDEAPSSVNRSGDEDVELLVIDERKPGIKKSPKTGSDTTSSGKTMRRIQLLRRSLSKEKASNASSISIVSQRGTVNSGPTKAAKRPGVSGSMASSVSRQLDTSIDELQDGQETIQSFQAGHPREENSNTVQKSHDAESDSDVPEPEILQGSARGCESRPKISSTALDTSGSYTNIYSGRNIKALEHAAFSSRSLFPPSIGYELSSSSGSMSDSLRSEALASDSSALRLHPGRKGTVVTHGPRSFNSISSSMHGLYSHMHSTPESAGTFPNVDVGDQQSRVKTRRDSLASVNSMMTAASNRSNSNSNHYLSSAAGPNERQHIVHSIYVTRPRHASQPGEKRHPAEEQHPRSSSESEHYSTVVSQHHHVPAPSVPPQQTVYQQPQSQSIPTATAISASTSSSAVAKKPTEESVIKPEANASPEAWYSFANKQMETLLMLRKAYAKATQQLSEGKALLAAEKGKRRKLELEMSKLHGENSALKSVLTVHGEETTYLRKQNKDLLEAMQAGSGPEAGGKKEKSSTDDSGWRAYVTSLETQLEEKRLEAGRAVSLQLRLEESTKQMKGLKETNATQTEEMGILRESLTAMNAVIDTLQENSKELSLKLKASQETLKVNSDLYEDAQRTIESLEYEKDYVLEQVESLQEQCRTLEETLNAKEQNLASLFQILCTSKPLKQKALELQPELALLQDIPLENDEGEKLSAMKQEVSDSIFMLANESGASQEDLKKQLVDAEAKIKLLNEKLEMTTLAYSQALAGKDIVVAHLAKTTSPRSHNALFSPTSSSEPFSPYSQSPFQAFASPSALMTPEGPLRLSPSESIEGLSPVQAQLLRSQVLLEETQRKQNAVEAENHALSVELGRSQEIITQTVEREQELKAAYDAVCEEVGVLNARVHELLNEKKEVLLSLETSKKDQISLTERLDAVARGLEIEKSEKAQLQQDVIGLKASYETLEKKHSSVLHVIQSPKKGSPHHGDGGQEELISLLDTSQDLQSAKSYTSLMNENDEYRAEIEKLRAHLSELQIGIEAKKATIPILEARLKELEDAKETAAIEAMEKEKEYSARIGELHEKVTALEGECQSLQSKIQTSETVAEQYSETVERQHQAIAKLEGTVQKLNLEKDLLATDASSSFLKAAEELERAHDLNKELQETVATLEETLEIREQELQSQELKLYELEITLRQLKDANARHEEEIAIKVSEISDLERKCKNSEDTMQQLTQENALLSEKIRKAEGDVESLNSKLDNLSDAAASKEEELALARKDMKELEAIVLPLQENIQQLEVELLRKSGEMEGYLVDRNESIQVLQELQSKYDSLVQELEESRVSAKQTDGELRALRGKLQATESQLEFTTQSLVAERKKNTQSTSQSSPSASRRKHPSSSHHYEEEDVGDVAPQEASVAGSRSASTVQSRNAEVDAAMEQEIVALRKEVGRLTEDNEKLRDALESLESCTTALMNKVSDTSKKAANAKRESQAMKRELEAKTARVTVLGEKNRELEEELKTLQQELKEKQKSLVKQSETSARGKATELDATIDKASQEIIQRWQHAFSELKSRYDEICSAVRENDVEMEKMQNFVEGKQ